MVETLYHRLRDAIENRWLTRHLTDAIAKLETGSTGARVRELLNGDEPLLQRAAMRILAKCPSANELDRLWELHMTGVRAPERFLREHESQHTLYEESFGALRECCRLNPAWLDRTIEHADPENDPVSDLAYLVGTIRGDEGPAIWRRNKNKLFEKVSSEKLRSIATCIGRYADTEELDWLLEHVSQTKDLTGSMAMRSLARIAPTVAVEHLNELPRRELVLASSWYADHLFVTCPNEMRSKLLEMMQDEDDPWEVAQVYSGREHHLDARTLDLLLDDLDARLEEVLATPGQGTTRPLFVPLRLLARVNARTTVERLRQRQGTSLESRLRDTLLPVGPGQGIAMGSLVRAEAVEVLYRLGGAGFTQVVNEFLTTESRDVRLDAIKLGAKRPDEGTIRRLTAISESEDTRDRHPIEQNEAATVLAEIGEWGPVLRFVERIGLRVSSDLIDFARRDLRPPSEFLTEVRSAILTQAADATPGSLLALGFGSPQDDSATVRGTLADCEPDSDLAHACVIALDMLRDASEESVPLLARQLTIQNHEFSVINALIVNGTQAALQALRSHTSERFDVAIGVNLINRLESSEDTIQEIGDAVKRELRERRW